MEDPFYNYLQEQADNFAAFEQYNKGRNWNVIVMYGSPAECKDHVILVGLSREESEQFVHDFAHWFDYPHMLLNVLRHDA